MSDMSSTPIEAPGKMNAASKDKSQRGIRLFTVEFSIVAIMFSSHTTASTDSKIRPPSREEAHDRRRKELDKMHGRSHSSQNARHPNLKNLTTEERAKYELERKKVAKYKEDKLKARRDHTRMILESHAQSKRRSLLGKQSEFLANLEFRNKLPDLPFDTKFLQYPHESDRLVHRKYTWDCSDCICID